MERRESFPSFFFSLSLPSNDSQSWECRLREQIVIDFYRVFIERCHVLKVRFNFVIARLFFLSIAFHFFSRRKNGWFPFFRKGNRESLEKLGIKLVVKFERSKSTEHKFENTFGRSKRVSRRLYHFAFSFFFFMAFMRVVLYNPRSIRTISAGLPPRINFISPLIILTRQSPFPVPLPVSFPLFFHPWLSVHRPPCDTRAIPITIPTMLFFSSHFPRSTRTISIHRVED